MNHVGEHKVNSIKPLHKGFGFHVQDFEIEKELSQNAIAKGEDTQVVNAHELQSQKSHVHGKKYVKANLFEVEPGFTNHSISSNRDYYVHPFVSFLSWTVDAIIGFSFLIISLCVNLIFLPKGFFDLTSSFIARYSIFFSNLNLVILFLFSIQVWFFMAVITFVFQYAILGFEGSTLGRRLFGVYLQNHHNKSQRVSESAKVCAAFSEALMLGSILSFLFVVLMPSRVPMFFWLRYSAVEDKNF